MKKLLEVLVTVGALTACVSTSSTVLNSGLVRPAISPDSVILYRNATLVPRKYLEIAILNSSGDESMTNEQQMYTSMREAAAKLGANGVILNDSSIKDASTTAEISHALIGTSANRKGKSVAIYVSPDTTTKK